MRPISITAVLIALLLCFGCTHSTPATESHSATEGKSTNAKSNIGFASRQKLAEHYEKHGAEFGSISIDEYLHQAQAMRDRPVGGDLLEFTRADGVTTRFDRKTGSFIAFNSDGTIRTFFKPNDGERYFLRQRDRD